MKTPSAILAILALASLPAFAGGSAPVIEQPATPPSEATPWEFNSSIYLWTQSLNGDIGILGRTASVDVSFNDILRNLDIAFMGAFEVKRGRWSAIADLMYADISSDDQIGETMIGIKQKQFLGNFTINYEALKTDDMSLVLYAGARVNWLDVSLGIDDLRTPNREFQRSDSKGWADPIIGARVRANLPRKFFVYASGDVGGFDVSSQFTWQAVAGFGYRVMDRGNILLGYRAIGTDYADGGFTYDVVASGPALGFEYKF